MNELAEQEITTVAPQLSMDELCELDRRIVEGEIEGRWYLSDDQPELCGCLYGTIAIARGLATTGDDEGQVIALKCDLNAIPSERRYGYFSPIEELLLHRGVEYGSTPDTSPVLAWLHDMLSAELNRRAQVAILELSR